MRRALFILLIVGFMSVSGPLFAEGQTGATQAGATVESQASVTKTLVREADEPAEREIQKVGPPKSRGEQKESAEESDSETRPVEKKVIRTLEKLSGTVTWLGQSSIAVLYETRGSEDFEMMLPLDPDLKLDHYKHVKDIKQGDLVNLQYEKALENPGEPNQRTTMSVKKISFVKRPSQNKGLGSEEQG